MKGVVWGSTFKIASEKLNEIIESESKDIERLAKDIFLWQDSMTEQKRIDKVL